MTSKKQFDRKSSSGDSFGVRPTPEAQYHRGTMRALTDDCQFVLVAHQDFVRIMNSVNQHRQQTTDTKTGEIISETERR